MPYKVTKSELNYYAGFFDGEGCIMITKERADRHRTLEVAITSTRLKVLEDFKLAFGGRVYGAVKGKGHYKSKWQWTIGANLARAFLEAVYPYLRLKKQEAELAMEFQRARIYRRNSLLKAGREAIEEAQYIIMKGLKK